jgi:hypothetical protein
MAPKFQDKEIEQLAAEIAKLAGGSEKEAVRQALRERLERLELQSGTPTKTGARPRPRPRTMEEMLHFMEEEIWPLIPEENRGRPPMTKAERAKLLGYGPDDD